MFKSVGTINCKSDRRMVLEVDQGIADFYRSLIPSYIRVDPQKHSAHISVIRDEPLPKNANLLKYNGEKIEFFYLGNIVNDEVYYWLPVECQRLKEIRQEIGISDEPSWHNKFHITIGNAKWKTS